MAVVPVQALGTLPVSPLAPLMPVQPPGTGAAPAPFAQLLTQGVESVNTDLLQADAMVRAFTLDDSVPIHQVTFALEQARLSMELMMQVRSKLLEGYQQLMNMQL